MGCIAFSIQVGGYLVTPEGTPEFKLHESLQLGGAPPEEWLKVWDLEKMREIYKALPVPLPPSFNRDRAWKSRLERSWASKHLSEEDPGIQAFLDLLWEMIRTEPGNRTQIADLLHHRYFRV